MGRLEGKVALITGTGGGIGRAAAALFAAEGATVVGCDLDPARAGETVELVRGAGGDMTSSAPVDVADEEAVRAWIDAAAAEQARHRRPLQQRRSDELRAPRGSDSR